jgi:hypothetical protein
MKCRVCVALISTAALALLIASGPIGREPRCVGVAVGASSGEGSLLVYRAYENGTVRQDAVDMANPPAWFHAPTGK